MEYTFFSSAHDTFSRTDYLLSHKASLNKFKKTEIISCIFFNHNGMKLEINRKKKIWKEHKYMEVKEHATKQWMGQPVNKRRN